MTPAVAYLGHALTPWPKIKKSTVDEFFKAKFLTGSVLLAILIITTMAEKLTSLNTHKLHTTEFLAALCFQVFLGIPLYVSACKRRSEQIFILFYALSLTLFVCASILLWRFQGSSFFLTSAFILYIAATLIFFITKRLVAGTKAIHAIKTLIIPHAEKQERQGFTQSPSKDLKVGAIIRVKTGQIIPADGKIIQGVTSVDESPITGECAPLPKGKGDRVVAGTVNRDNEILIEITSAVAGNVIRKIHGAATQHLKENTPAYVSLRNFCFTLQFIGVVITGITFFYEYIVTDLPFVSALKTSACLILSFSLTTILPHMNAASLGFIGSLFQKGIFLKNLKKLTTLTQVHTVYFNKTGTLTRGNLEYAQSFIEYGTNQGKFLSTVFSLESAGKSRYSLALESHPWYNEISKNSVREHKVHAGLGVSGNLQPKGWDEYFAALGNLRLIKRLQMMISRDMKAKIDELEALGETVLLCGYDRRVQGLLSFTDNIRPHVREVLADIKKQGIELGIITGDAEDSLAPLISGLNIKKVYSRCTPEEKVAKLTRDKHERLTVGYVGTSKDVDCLTKADVGLVLNTKTNIDSVGDILIMGRDLKLIPWILAQTKILYTRAKLFKKVIFSATVVLTSLSFFHLATPELILAVVLALNVVSLRQLGKIF